MSVERMAPREGLLPRWFRGVCLLLVVLLFHNPYLIVPGMADGLKVSHPPSYRATVAASELQHFTPPGAQAAFPALAGPASKELEPLQSDGRPRQICGPRVLSPPQRFLCAALWFRPPPIS